MSKWEEYCPACGLPFRGYGWMMFAVGYEINGGNRVFKLDNYNGKGTFQIMWMIKGNKSKGYENNFRVIHPSEFPAYARKVEAQTFIASATPGRTPAAHRPEGIVIHLYCVEAIESALNIELTYKDVMKIKLKAMEYGHPDLLGCDKESDFLDCAEAVRKYRNRARVPEWIISPANEYPETRDRIIKKLPAEIKERSIGRARAVHTLVKHIEEIPTNLAPLITEYATGRKPNEYMRDRSAMGGKRTTRRIKRTKRQTRRR